MTDEQASNVPANTNQTDDKLVNTGIDPFLSFFIKLVRDENWEIGITLYLKGNVISGLAISPDKYFDGLAQEFDKTKGSDIHQAFAEAFRFFQKDIVSERLKQKNETNKTEPVYIHLKNVKFLSGVIHNFDNTDIYWRGRLDQVDGFSIGNF